MLKNVFDRSACGSLLFSASLLASFGVSSADAKVERPTEIFSESKTHCDTPQWSPDGKQLAFETYQPKSEIRGVRIVKVSSSLSVNGSGTPVLPLGIRANRLSGNKLPPVVEFSWTPDMEMLESPYVFSSQALNRKNFDIYVDGNWITQANSGNDGQPVFSPDSNYLAYTSQQLESGDIMLIDFAGDMQPTRLTNTANTTEYLPQWHPTQPRLLFIRSQKTRGQDIVVINDPKNPAGSLQDVTNWRADEIRPRWSPDGTKIAFYSNQDTPNDKIYNLWVINADGSGAKMLVKDVFGDKNRNPVWSEDGRYIFFVKHDLDRANPIMWVDIQSKKKGVITQETQLNEDLSIHYKNGVNYLAYSAQGFKDSTDKTWKRIFVVRFKMSDLRR